MGLLGEWSAAMMHNIGYPAQWGWMIFGTIAMIVFSIAVVWAVAWTVAIAMQHRIHPAPRESDAGEILRRRYAAGELDDAEYERRLQVLHRNP
jgi:putative membrane protein